MVDLAVGTEFYYKGSLCKVFEAGHEHDYDKCSRCDMSLSECSIMNCASGARKDGKSVYFKWIGDTENTEDIEDTEDIKDTEEAMNEVTASEECCDKEKTLTERIRELKIEESLKEGILKRIASLEKRNDELVDVVDRYSRSTQRLERAIVTLAAKMADNDESIMRDELIHLSGLYPDYYMPGEKGRECMEERKTPRINPKAICNHCYYAHSCEEVLRGLEMLECSMYRNIHEDKA